MNNLPCFSPPAGFEIRVRGDDEGSAVRREGKGKAVASGEWRVSSESQRRPHRADEARERNALRRFFRLRGVLMRSETQRARYPALLVCVVESDGLQTARMGHAARFTLDEFWVDGKGVAGELAVV